MKCAPDGTVASSSPAEVRRSTFYTDGDVEDIDSKLQHYHADRVVTGSSSSEEEIVGLRGELEAIQRALRHQTRRCRQLVTEYTKRLQLKEHHYQAEKRLRDDQLAKVLRALLIFEARLKQEQKLITRRLREKDQIIRHQQEDMRKLLLAGRGNFCSKCRSSLTAEDVCKSDASIVFEDSSSEYVATTVGDYQDYCYQSSNFESLDSSSETYASISEKDYELKRLARASDPPSLSSEDTKDHKKSRHLYMKNSNKNSLTRRNKKFVQKKSVDSYQEATTSRTGSDARSLTSEDNLNSGDYENLDSLPSETPDDSNFEEDQDSKREDHSTYSYVSDSLDTTVIVNNHKDDEETTQILKISETIPVFDADEETNDNQNWYASASDQEDEQLRDVYRNNPVLECMNQILLQNINDISSPPKSPNVEKRPGTNSKKVKFSDEEDKSQHHDGQIDYYETPIQKSPNFYETPQSIYSNDYEQILSQCSDAFAGENRQPPPPVATKQTTSPKPKFSSTNSDDTNNHYYIDMDSTKSESESRDAAPIIRRSKILRTPPALPPKPANLITKYRTQSNSWSDQHSDQEPSRSNEKSTDSEPDYCSISEINLPKETRVSLQKSLSNKKLSLPPEESRTSDIDESPSPTKMSPTKTSPVQYRPISLGEPISPTSKLAVRKSVEKFKTPLAKKTPIKQSSSASAVTEVKKSPISDEIPKLPQVTEIIIPDENEAISEEYVNHDNYIKNNTQILIQQQHTNGTVLERNTRPPLIQMGSSVSSLIATFNNKQMSEVKQLRHKTAHKTEENRNNKKRLFSSIENLNNAHTFEQQEEKPPPKSFDVFDLSQNFEEFKLDDSEIEDYEKRFRNDENGSNDLQQQVPKSEPPPPTSPTTIGSSTRVEMVRATSNFSLAHLKPRPATIEKDKVVNRPLKKDVVVNNDAQHAPKSYVGEPTYEHFLECTGLSSKSILTPSRLLSNHKNMLKPKDVKLRSKIKANVYERPIENGTVRYWSEPYL